MAGVGPLISSLISQATNLLPEVKNSFFAPSSSSWAQSPNTSDVENDLNALIRILESIKNALCVVEEREFRDRSVKLWIKKLKEVGYAAEYAIDEYMHEVYRARVEARNAFKLNPFKRKHEERSDVASCAISIRVPDGIVDIIRDIRSKFDQIEMHREALKLPESDAPRRDEGLRFRAPTTHLFNQSSIFGREMDKEKVIDLLLSDNKRVITVVPIVGKGGIGKTTLAQFVFDDKRVKHNFNLFGWTDVSQDLVVERLLQNLIESFTEDGCPLKDLCSLNEKIKSIVRGKRVLIVLDDVWSENKTLWELFYVPYLSALSVAFLVTTRSEAVAKTMQATSIFRLGYLPEEKSWSLFRHYAFRGTNSNVNPKMINIGRQITKKCGGLPLAVKSISNLLHFENEKGWINILQNDLWGDNDDDKVFRVLQISYARMPAYLRPCFLYCSLFPKNYVYSWDEVIELWIVEGYIEFKEGRSLEEIGFAYAHELTERSFFDIYDVTYKSRDSFKIHDIVHDLARLNSGYEFYSAERGKISNPHDGVLHFYMEGSEAILNHLTPNSVAKIRTILIDIRSESNFVDLSDAKSLRTLKLYKKRKNRYGGLLLNYVFPKHLRFLEINCKIEGPLSDSVFSLYHLKWLTLDLQYDPTELEALRNLINLEYLSLSQCNAEKLLESLCLLRNLKMLSLRNCTSVGLPQKVGDLAQLEKLVIDSCGVSEILDMLPESFCKLPNLITFSITNSRGFKELPKDLGNLTNLQSLVIKGTGISYLPDSINQLNTCSQFDVQICPIRKGLYDTIAWLKGFDNFKGTLVILQLGGLPRVENARDFNLHSKSNIDKLLLSWEEFFPCKDENKLEIKINRFSIRITKDKNFQILESLQPHPNVKYLGISFYDNDVFPIWMGDPLICTSLKKILIDNCRMTYLPFGNLTSLIHLKIDCCDKLKTISRESLPLRLQRLIIYSCFWLLSITGVDDLESLVELKVHQCTRLVSFPFELISEDRCYKPSSSGLKNLHAPKTVKIGSCPLLQLMANEVVPSANCKVEIYDCLGLEKWCLQHNISYTPRVDLESLYSSDSSESDGALDDLDEDILENNEFNNLDRKGKQTLEIDEVGNSSSLGRHISAGENILKHMEQGSSSVDVMDEDVEKGNFSTDVMDED